MDDLDELIDRVTASPGCGVCKIREAAALVSRLRSKVSGSGRRLVVARLHDLLLERVEGYTYASPKQLSSHIKGCM